MKLKYLKLRHEIISPDALHDRFTPRGRDVFETEKSETLTLEDLGEKIRITGAYGTRLTSWANVIEAEPVPEPSTETAKAAASKTRGATSK